MVLTYKAAIANRRGMILPFVLAFAMIVLIFAFSLIFMVQTEHKLTNKFVDHSIAEQIAESGVEQALFYMKSDLETNSKMLQAMKEELESDIPIPVMAKDEIREMAGTSGTYDLELKVSYEPTPSPFPGMGVYSGDVRIQSRGIYITSLGEIVKKQVLAVYAVRAVNLGIVAPDHSLFLRDKEHLNYNFEDNFDPSDLNVMAGDVYVENGLTAELSDYNKRRMIEKGELTWQEYYYMDHPPNTQGLADGGVDFLDADQVEYKRYGIFRKFKIFGREVKEKYSTKVFPSHNFWTDEQINLRPLEFYKTLARVRLEPQRYNPAGGSVRDNRYFKNVIFEGENGYNSVRYNNVLPLYGYGDWRRAPVFDGNRYGPRSREHDLRNPINVDGIVFVRGDVFVEGWYKGVGVLVVQGNVYVGGSLNALPVDTAGHPSLWNILAFEDPNREHSNFTPTNHPSFRKTGHIIIKPHPDNDWSESGGQDPDPRPKVDAALYTQNGLKTDKEAFRDNWADLGSLDVDLKHNLVADALNMNFIPKDLIINGIDPNDEFREAGGQSLEEFLQPEFNVILKSWVIETIDSTESLEDEGQES